MTKRLVHIPDEEFEALVELLDDLDILPGTLDALLNTVVIKGTFTMSCVSQEEAMEALEVPLNCFNEAAPRVLSIIDGKFSGWMPLRGSNSSSSAFVYYTNETKHSLLQLDEIQFYRTDTFTLLSLGKTDKRIERIEALAELCA